MMYSCDKSKIKVRLCELECGDEQANAVRAALSQNRI